MITNESQQKAHKIYIFSQFVAPTCFGRACVPSRPPHSAHASTQDILNIYTQLFNFSTLISIINIPHYVWVVYNILINNYTLDECTYRCITYSVTAHPDDGQARPNHVGATN